MPQAQHLNPPSRIAVIYNPCSGGGDTGRDWPQLEARLREVAGQFSAIATRRPNQAWALARQALLDGFDRIVCVGGDGTLNEVVGGFFDEGKPVNPAATLAVLPQGTASDFPRSLGLPRDDDAFELASSPATVPVDVGLVSLHDDKGAPKTAYFINVAHFGLGGVISRRVSRGKKFLGGFVPYFLGMARTMWRFDKPRMELEIDGKVMSGRFLNIFAANGRFCGGGLEVAPHAQLDDGRLALTLIGDLGRAEALRGIVSLYLMHYVNAEKVWTLEAKEIRATSPSRVLINLDGEPAGQLPLRIRMLPGALRVAVAPEEDKAH